MVRRKSRPSSKSGPRGSSGGSGSGDDDGAKAPKRRARGGKDGDGGAAARERGDLSWDELKRALDQYPLGPMVRYEGRDTYMRAKLAPGGLDDARRTAKFRYVVGTDGATGDTLLGPAFELGPGEWGRVWTGTYHVSSFFAPLACWGWGQEGGKGPLLAAVQARASGAAP